MNATRRALAKAVKAGDIEEFRRWVEQFYDADQAAFIARDLLPTMLGLAEAIYADSLAEIDVVDPEATDLEEWATGWAERYGLEVTKSSRNQLFAIVKQDLQVGDYELHVTERLDDWEVGRAASEAFAQTKGLSNKATLRAFKDGGRTSKRWHSNRGACPLCRKMHGRTSSISEPFLRKGEVVDPEDEETTPLTVERNFSVPQLHKGCDCTIVAE